MREILFRGKRLDNGEWVEGYYILFQIGNKPVPVIVPYAPLIETLQGHWLYQVNPATVSQYTGLTDKNGVKIFEGDRVRVPMFRIYNQVSERGTIEFRGAAFSVKWDDENYGRNFAGYLDDMEVIGNIHDNPELMEGGAT